MTNDMCLIEHVAQFLRPFGAGALFDRPDPGLKPRAVSLRRFAAGDGTNRTRRGRMQSHVGWLDSPLHALSAAPDTNLRRPLNTEN